MEIDSVASLVQTLKECQLLEPAQSNVLATDLQQRFPNPKSLVQELLRRDWLTAFQVQQLSKGRAGVLVFGHYVVLDLLGEGGMGRVYKARHRGMTRLVALKVIRRDMVADADTVSRFYREMK